MKPIITMQIVNVNEYPLFFNFIKFDLLRNEIKNKINKIVAIDKVIGMKFSQNLETQLLS